MLWATGAAPIFVESHAAIRKSRATCNRLTLCTIHISTLIESRARFKAGVTPYAIFALKSMEDTDEFWILESKVEFVSGNTPPLANLRVRICAIFILLLIIVVDTGFEPVTSTMSTWHSNHLS